MYVGYYKTCTLKEKPNLKFENGGLLLDNDFINNYFDETFVNTSQQPALYDQHIKHSKRQLNLPKQYLFIHQQHQYKMSNLNKY